MERPVTTCPDGSSLWGIFAGLWMRVTGKPGPTSPNHFPDHIAKIYFQPLVPRDLEMMGMQS